MSILALMRISRLEILLRKIFSIWLKMYLLNLRISLRLKPWLSTFKRPTPMWLRRLPEPNTNWSTKKSISTSLTCTKMPQEALLKLRGHHWSWKNHKEREKLWDLVYKNQSSTELKSNRNQWSKWSMKRCFQWFQAWWIRYMQKWRQNLTTNARTVWRKRWISSMRLMRK